ncbi:MAG: ORF6C domain-containing protein, partial [Flavobacteriaceae bacterium]|nr:ORF6C domain-containing protein [Flavobacteriaceae bacterium]
MSVTEGFRRIIENKVQEILKKTDRLSTVGTKVTELNNTSYVSQNFKKQISWSFAGLVGMVISGFFIIAYKDEEIRKTIFSG